MGWIDTNFLTEQKVDLIKKESEASRVNKLYEYR